MILPEINSALVRRGLPALTAIHLAKIDESGQRLRFEHALDSSIEGDLASETYLNLVLRGTAEWLPQFLANLQLTYEPRQFICVALQEGMLLFRAIHAVRSGHESCASAERYLLGLGLNSSSATQDTVAPAAPYYSFHIYGQSAALCISEAKTRATLEATVQIEGAGALGAGTRSFDWPNKIIVQLTPQECILMLAVLRNVLPAVEFKGHGRGHDKMLSVENQGGRYFVRLAQMKRAPVAVPVQPVDAVRVIALLTRQISANMPLVDAQHLDRLIADMASMMKS